MHTQSFAALDVLVCDPSPHMYTLIGQMLRHIKVHAIEDAETSNAATSALTNRKFGLVMIDDGLGPTDAVDLVRALRTHEGGPNRETPVIMMSSAPDAARIVAARDAGVTEFLRKPFAAAHVEMRLKSIFGAPRNFVEGGGYQGPDRRRREARFDGQDRRAVGTKAAE